MVGFSRKFILPNLFGTYAKGAISMFIPTSTHWKKIWNDRPSIPKNKIEVQPLQYAGETTASKLARIRKALAEQQADGILVSAIDEIAGY